MIRGARGLDTELRQIALARALVGLELNSLAIQTERATAYFRAGCASPITAAEDEDAVRRELLRRSLSPVRLGAAA